MIDGGGLVKCGDSCPSCEGAAVQFDGRTMRDKVSTAWKV